jgi:hypothetical protein
MKKLFSALCLLTAFTAISALDCAKYSIADTPWDEELGNHRAVVKVSDSNLQNSIHIPWRLKHNPYFRKLVIIEASTGKKVKFFDRKRYNKDEGNIVFKPYNEGIYYIYYLPFSPSKTFGGMHAPYKPLNISTYVGCGKKAVAELIQIEARTELDSFYPMGVQATKSEAISLKFSGKNSYMLFPEGPEHQIRPGKDIPYKWIKNGEAESITLNASKNQYLTFQAGILAHKSEIKNIRPVFSDITGPVNLDKSVFTSFNTEGIDPYGNFFKKTLNIAKNYIQPLWIGVDLPKDLPAGEYKGSITLKSDNAADRTLNFFINIQDKILADRGDSDLSKMSRLRWLNSTAGLDENKMVEGYTPVAISNLEKNMTLTNKAITLSKQGLPESIKINNREILSSEVKFEIPGFSINQTDFNNVLEETNNYSAKFKSQAGTSTGSISTETKIEADGYCEFNITIKAEQKIDTGEIKLSIPMKNEIAQLIFGMGLPGTRMPDSHKSGWVKYKDSFWAGSPEAGIHCELKGASYTGPLLKLYDPEFPDSWHNSGKGNFRISKDKTATWLEVCAGSRTLKPGQEIKFSFAFILTPVKPINWTKHFNNRYYHPTPVVSDTMSGANNNTVYNANEVMPSEQDIAKGVKIINIHHSHPQNPYINYPFRTPERIKDFTKEAHNKGLKVKIYYTVRELSQAAYEIFALRSLDEEVFKKGKTFDEYIWQKEHLDNDYIRAWYSYNGTKIPADCAMETSPDSRWYNYYIEGLKYMIENYDIDGIYMDDVAFDRIILKRMRRVMDEVKPGCLIDLHSNTGFSKGPALQYTGFFPYIDRVWFGESFIYNKMTPEEFLVEASGIPFGITGNMLHKGGNPWRGMVYGMTCRFPWYTEGHISDPRPLWNIIDYIGKDSPELLPYWNNKTPIKTDNSNVTVSIIKNKNKLIIAAASWSNRTENFKLKIDYTALGTSADSIKLFQPEIAGMQQESETNPDTEYSVEPLSGKILILELE